MNKLLPALLLLACCLQAHAQTTITAADMPVAGDSLRWSADLAAVASISTGATGAEQTWDFSQLNATTQGLDEYKTAAQVNFTYVATIGYSAYGYKLGDSIPGIGGLLPVQVSDVYSFFEKRNSPSRFVACAFAANIGGLPAPSNYSNDDEIYFFPLAYGDADTSTYKVTIGFSFIGTVKLAGTRTTVADGYGAIQTPYYTTPVSCLRVRTETNEVDSVDFAGATFGLPRRMVEYKWLTNGDHYPALWVTANVLAGTEIPTAVRYRDTYRPLGISSANTPKTALGLHPNPATGNEVILNVPPHWHNYAVEVYDATGKLVAQQAGSNHIAVSALPAGSYLVRAWNGSEVGFAKFVR